MVGICISCYHCDLQKKLRMMVCGKAESEIKVKDKKFENICSRNQCYHFQDQNILAKIFWPKFAKHSKKETVLLYSTVRLENPGEQTHLFFFE